MNRREFLKVSGSVTAWLLVEKFFFWPSPAAAAVNRLDKWAPATDPTIRVEWRYVAGRIVDGAQDFGFLVSISDIKVSGAEGNALTVHRQDFVGAQAFTGEVYFGDLTYDSASATYTFKDGSNQELASWQWDESAQEYKLTVSTPELTLTNVAMIPQGPLVEEGGDGHIKVGRIGVIVIDSDYYGDWTKIKINGDEKGFARIDFQGLRKTEISTVVSNDYDHRWFAIAVDLADGSPAWISAWKIEDADGPFWGVTIARGSDTTWTVTSFTEEDEGSMAAPLNITATAWQDVPANGGPSLTTGKAWQLTAGTTQPNDLLNLQVAVPAGQFITVDTNTLASWLEEGVGIEVTGTVLGSAINSVKMVAAESSTESSPDTEPGANTIFLPLILKN